MKIKQLMKQSYNFIPFKKEAFSVLKSLWVPPENVYKHLHFKGVFKVNIDSKTAFLIRHYGFLIENEIFWGGLLEGHEKVSMNLWIKLARRAKVIIDVGANTGIYSLVAKAVNPQSEIYAFEPIDRVYEKLCENITLNNYDIVSIKEALSDSDGEATVFDTAHEHTYSVTVGKNLNPPEWGAIPTTIRTTRFDTFFTSSRLGSVDLIKIDVETHEPEVLKGMGEILDKFRPPMLIEILNDEVADRIEEIVKDKGYLYFAIDDAKGTYRQTDRVRKSDFFNYLFCDERVAKSLSLI